MAEAADIDADLQHGAEITARDAAIADLRQQVATRDADISAASARVAELEATIASLRTDLAAQGTHIASLEAMAAAAAAAADIDAVPVPAGTPQEIMLTSPYGFIDEAGRNRSWLAGARIRNPSQVALLISRGAEHQVTIA